MRSAVPWQQLATVVPSSSFDSQMLHEAMGEAALDVSDASDAVSFSFSVA